MIKWIERWVKAENRAMDPGVPPYRPLSYWWCFPLQFLIIAMWIDSRLAVSWAHVGWLDMRNSNGVILLKWAKPSRPGTVAFTVNSGRRMGGSTESGQGWWTSGKFPDAAYWLGIPYDLLLAGFTVGWVGLIGVKRLRYQRQVVKIAKWEEHLPGQSYSPSGDPRRDLHVLILELMSSIGERPEMDAPESLSHLKALLPSLKDDSFFRRDPEQQLDTLNQLQPVRFEGLSLREGFPADFAYAKKRYIEMLVSQLPP